MFKGVEFTAVDLAVEREWELSQTNEDNRTLDDLERPVLVLEPPANMFYTIMVAPAHVRSFYPRKRGKPGTRIVYMTGAADIVTASYQEVLTKFNSLNN